MSMYIVPTLTRPQQSSKINNLCEKLCQTTPTQPHRATQDSYNKLTILMEFVAVAGIFIGMIAFSWAGCALIDKCYADNVGGILR